MTTYSSPSAARDLQPIEVPLNKEDARLIWLDANIDDSNDSQHMQALFLELNPAAQFYTDITKCVTFMKSSHDEQILLVVSGTVAQQLLSQVHNLRSLAAIFILCENCPPCPELLNQYSRIINIFTDRNSLLLSIRDTLDIVEKQLLAFSLFDQKQKSTRDLSKESTSFIWHQLLIDVLKKMPHDEKAKNDMLTLCSKFYAMKKEELNNIKEFRESYKREEAIPWYTKECFLYKLLNRAIRTEDIELLYSFRFFIADLCDQLKQESEKLKGDDILTLYRGQQIPKEELENLRKSTGCLISTNGFLSTSRDVKVALNIVGQRVKKSDMETCIFEIHADPSLKSIVFADIDQYSKIEGEQEVLFGLNATFRLGLIGMDPELQMIKVSLTATDEGTTYFEKYMQEQENEMKDYCPMVYFGRILWRDLGRADRAKKYFDMLLKTLPKDHPDMSDVYNEVAPLWNEIRDLDLALENYVKGYEIRKRTLQQNHPKISISLNNIGITYAEMNKHDTALEYYFRSLAITEVNTPNPNEDWALRLHNIGITYLLKDEYDMALTFVRLAYDIYTRVRPDQYRDKALCLGAIGNVYVKKGDIDRALSYYHQQLEMNEKCLSLDHPGISANIDWIAHTYMRKGDPQKAFAFCEEKLAMQKSILGEDHPRIASTLMTIGRLHGGRRGYFNKALCILEKYTPKDDLRTIECLKALGDLDLKENKFENGLAHWMRILDIRRRIHSSDNPKIASTLQSIGEIYFGHMKNYSEALRYYSESLAVYRATYRPEHKNIIQINRMIGKTRAMIDSDEDDCKNVAVNTEDYRSLSKPDSDVPASTTSYICVLL